MVIIHVTPGQTRESKKVQIVLVHYFLLNKRKGLFHWTEKDLHLVTGVRWSLQKFYTTLRDGRHTLHVGREPTDRASSTSGESREGRLRTVQWISSLALPFV